MSTNDAVAKKGIEQRTINAATESMTVTRDAAGSWTVSKADVEYIVVLGTRGYKCECADHHYRHNECKHIRRVQMIYGSRPVPELDRLVPIDVELEIRAKGLESDDVSTDGGTDVSGADDELRAETCPNGHTYCDGHDSELERPELCGECWSEWAAYDPDDFKLDDDELEALADRSGVNR